MIYITISGILFDIWNFYVELWTQTDNCWNLYRTDPDYCRFQSVLLVDQITVIGNEMGVWTSSFENICAQIKQILVIFIHLKLWVAVQDKLKVGENSNKTT